MNLAAPLRVIIVEDQVSIRQHLEEFVPQQPGFIVTGACGTVHEAIVLVHTSKPDLLLLDIELLDGTGFDILEQIPAPLKVIFLTGFEEYALRALHYGAIDYLLKPLNENELKKALQKAISAQPLLQEQIDITVHSFREKKMQDRIAVEFQNIVYFVEITQISYLHIDNGCTFLFKHDGKKLVSTRPLKSYEDAPFLRTHKSYLVNKFYIDRYHRKEGIIYLKNGTQIPVSSRKKEIVELHIKTL